MNTILVVDDEKSLQYSLKRIFENEYSVLTADDGCTALEIISSSENRVDVVFLDVRMPGMGGIEVLKRIKGILRHTPVIMMTAFSDSDSAIEAMKEGAFDYISKPFEADQLMEVLKNALSSARLHCETSCCCEIEDLADGVETIVGRSQAIINICKMIGQAAGPDVPVLLTGESGVGKEIVARAIYNHGSRKGRPFMAVNCAAIAEGVVESELFGFEKGAFTGAEKRRIGRFEQCNTGTIFLDEIGDMNPSTQAKLLRVLQDGTFERIGSNETITTDVRVIAASNKNLNEEVKKGSFREDLFHRLNVFSIYIPPLRERKVDIPVLAEYFIVRAANEMEKQIRGMSPEAMKLFNSYDWPGNVRELENVLRRAAVVTSGDVIDINDISLNPEPYKKGISELSEVIEDVFDRAVSAKETNGIYRTVVSSAEKTLIEKALKITKGNQVQASELLGITRVTLRKKIQEYHITLT
jgi:DNA-binding NtrC family response regulator